MPSPSGPIIKFINLSDIVLWNYNFLYVLKTYKPVSWLYSLDFNSLNLGFFCFDFWFLERDRKSKTHTVLAGYLSVEEDLVIYKKPTNRSKISQKSKAAIDLDQNRKTNTKPSKLKINTFPYHYISAVVGFSHAPLISFGSSASLWNLWQEI